MTHTYSCRTTQRHLNPLQKLMFRSHFLVTRTVDNSPCKSGRVQISLLPTSTLLDFTKKGTADCLSPLEWAHGFHYALTAPLKLQYLQ